MESDEPPAKRTCNGCRRTGCTNKLVYGYSQDQPEYCSNHRTPDMRDVVAKTCRHENCRTQPTFGLHAGKAMYCGIHRTPDMYDVKSKTCQHENCRTRPAFGLHAGKPMYCGIHRTPDMRDVVSKTCQHENCRTRPAFGLYAGKPVYCADHRSPDMRNVISKTCQFDGCRKLPTFGLHIGKPVYCADHRSPDMYDVVNKTCQYDGCDKQRRYGMPGHPVTVCAEHKESGMLPYSNRRCVAIDCREIAIFGTLKKQLHCADHAVEGEVNIVEQRCTSCGLMNIVSPVTKQCAYCDPKQTIYRPVKWKELDVKSVLLQAGWTDLVHDRRLQDACGLKDRPDFVIDVGSRIIIVEVDEHQHRDRLCARQCICPDNVRHCKCQQARMFDTSQQFGGMPVVWIRFNPDDFDIRPNTKGKVNAAVRRQELVRMVRFVANQPMEWMEGHLTKVCYMYYDGDNIQWDSIIQYNLH